MFHSSKRCASYKAISVFFSAVLAGLSFGQSLDLPEAVRRGLASSPSIQAAQERVAAARAAVSRARAGFNPEVELAPGLGFTNGNNLLSQRFDIGGVRAAQTAVAQAELESALADLQAATQTRAAEISSAYYNLVRSRAEAAVVSSSADLAARLVDLVKKRVQIGEAAEVQATRAEIEALRVQQELVRARGSVETRLAVLRALLGDESLTVEAIPLELPAPSAAPTVSEVLTQALANRADISHARSLIAAARAEVGLARANRKPTLHAGVAADIWSLDRNPFQSQNFGLQAFLSFPLFDRGSLRAEDQRNQALVRAAEAELAAAERTVRLEVTRSLGELAARRTVADNYRTQILPAADRLVKISIAGYEAGLTTLIDVLDAQRTARVTQTEYLSALYEAALAELELRRATATLAPSTQEIKK
jgi:outer membrane protein TolC